jgi:hypothetical protein
MGMLILNILLSFAQFARELTREPGPFNCRERCGRMQASHSGKKEPYMSSTCRPLIEVLRQVPDPRARRGRRHPVAALLALACAAMLCGYRSYSAIAEWGRNYDPALLRALGFTRATAPCAATLFHVLRRLNREEFELLLGEWAQEVLGAMAQAGEPDAVLALDGKSLRGSQKQGAPGCHLLSVVSHQLGLTVAQTGVDDKTNEIPVAGKVLAGLVLQGRVFTMDALLTQRQLAAQIVAEGGDYVMLAKGNQPTLEQDIATVFAAPPLRESSGAASPPRRRDMDASRGDE